MSDQHSNPFVLPGMGQNADLSGNPLLASMEMMRQAWAGLTGPGGLASSLPMAPPMNLEDLDRRIAELRSVENWLRMNLSMLSSTIQGMEVQRSTIATLRAFVSGGTGDGPSPLEVVLGLKPAPGAAPTATASEAFSRTQTPSPSSTEAPPSADDENAAPTAGADAASMADQMNQAAQSASQAWWNLLQQQFSQIATATASSMPDPAAMQAAAQAATQAATQTAAPAAAPAAPVARKRAPRKAAAKRAPTIRKS